MAEKQTKKDAQADESDAGMKSSQDGAVEAGGEAVKAASQPASKSKAAQADVETEDSAPDEPILGRLREPFLLYDGSMAHKLPAGQPLRSQDYDLEKLVAKGAQIDVIDPVTGEVEFDLNEQLA